MATVIIGLAYVFAALIVFAAFVTIGLFLVRAVIAWIEDEE